MVIPTLKELWIKLKLDTPEKLSALFFAPWGMLSSLKLFTDLARMAETRLG
jgi:hypothetical protein